MNLVWMLAACNDLGLEQLVEDDTALGDVDTDADGDVDGDADGDADSDTDGDLPDASGYYTGIVEYDYLVTGCPECFRESAGANLSSYVMGIFHGPTSSNWTDWVPAVGTCEANPAQTQPTSSFDDLGGLMYLETGTQGSIALQFQGSSGLYLSDDLGQDDYIKNAAWDLDVPDGGDYGAFTLEGVLQTTGGLDDIDPIEILNPWAQAFAPFPATSATFTWSPSGVSESVIVAITVYSDDGARELGQILCRDTDTGRMTVPSNYFNGYPQGSLLAIMWYRWQTAEAIHPVDGSTVQGVTLYGLRGTGVLLN